VIQIDDNKNLAADVPDGADGGDRAIGRRDADLKSVRKASEYERLKRAGQTDKLVNVLLAFAIGVVIALTVHTQTIVNYAVSRIVVETQRQ
jgi:hypothetical protein